MIELVIFQCKSHECEARFALEEAAAVFFEEEITCPACGADEWAVLGPAKVPMPVGATEEAVARRTCRVCGCTQYSPCEEGCRWVEEDLCSECVADDTPEERSASEGDIE